MKHKLTKSLVAVVFGASIAIPYTVSANERVWNQKELFELTTLTGQLKAGIKDGVLNEALFTSPSALLQLQNGKLLISDSENHLIRMIDNNKVSTYHGNILDFDSQAMAIGAYADGDYSSAFFDNPLGIAEDLQGNIYVADSQNHAIRKINKDGIVSTVAGNGIAGYQDGNGQMAQFNYPSDVVVDKHGNVYVADSLNHAIRKIDPNGIVTTLNHLSTRIVEYFSGAIVETGDFQDGPLNESLFNEPSSLAIDDKGNLYVSDTGNQRIRYIDFGTNTVSTVAGGGELAKQSLYVSSAYKDGQAFNARFANPLGINIASDGSLLIADSMNHAIRILSNGEVKTLAGQAEEYGTADGILVAARIHQPMDVLETTDGKIVIADANNNKVRIIDRYTEEEHVEDGKIHIFLHGKLLKSDVPAQNVKGSIVVPIRDLADGLGYKVTNQKLLRSSTVIVNEHLKFIFAHNGKYVKKVTPEGVEKILMTSINQQNRLLVPVRFVSEQLGLDVQWDEDHQHVVIRSKIFE